MNELQAMMAKFLKLAQAHPDLLFRISPSKSGANWDVEFTKGGYWWTSNAGDLCTALEGAMDDFELLADQHIMDKLQKERAEVKE